MPTRVTSPPVTLIPAQRQTLWRLPAVLNFALGGLGAGFYAVAAVGSGFGPAPTLTLASWLGPALVLAGFVAVATEAGRPLRGPRVLARVRSSWMSRELVLGAVFAALAAAELVVPGPLTRAAATGAALGLALAQGLILRQARGVPAWAVPAVPPLFLSSALVSGAGLLALLAPAMAAGGRVLGSMLVLLSLHVLAWAAYVTASTDDAFVRAVGPLRRGRHRLIALGGGYLGPVLLVAFALALPGQAPPFVAAAGLAMVLSQAALKAALVLEAGRLRPITLAALALGRRSA